MSGSKFRFEESNFDDIFNLCVALTNIHIKWKPLPENDGTAFERMRKRLYTIVDEIVTKRKRVQADYRARRRARMARSFGCTADERAAAGAMLDLFDR